MLTILLWELAQHLRRLPAFLAWQLCGEVRGFNHRTFGFCWWSNDGQHRLERGSRVLVFPTRESWNKWEGVQYHTAWQCDDCGRWFMWPREENASPAVDVVAV